MLVLVRSGARAQRSGARAQRSGARAQRSGARAQRSGARARIPSQSFYLIMRMNTGSHRRLLICE